MDKYKERGFPGGSVVKNPPTMRETQETQETWVWSPGGKDLLEKGMATHSSILAWEIPRTEEPDGLCPLMYPQNTLRKTTESVRSQATFARAQG